MRKARDLATSAMSQDLQSWKTRPARAKHGRSMGGDPPFEGRRPTVRPADRLGLLGWHERVPEEEQGPSLRDVP